MGPKIKSSIGALFCGFLYAGIRLPDTPMTSRIGHASLKAKAEAHHIFRRSPAAADAATSALGSGCACWAVLAWASLSLKRTYWRAKWPKRKRHQRSPLLSQLIPSLMGPPAFHSLSHRRDVGVRRSIVWYTMVQAQGSYRPWFPKSHLVLGLRTKV